MFKITKITELDGETPKESAVHRVGRVIHFIHEPQLNAPALMAHADNTDLVTRTSLVKEIAKKIDGSKNVRFATMNTIYELEYLPAKEFEKF